MDNDVLAEMKDIQKRVFEKNNIIIDEKGVHFSDTER